ncbi:putative RNA-binding protein Musashi [Monocercomonoides exilis]|uniref:putative RNA-binding protein Musashi n=1 Tax=Monocercomonoides exilis TaxID=2049356 RepID=UPI00355982F6|nr:putative RNA-binding protein Musashi [Monocercomonoides exilis]|eukprot:MONOS_8270.1-p1 / transcript=MONOS_8270.1 / gene=MONOS_8270 / organism=Monocercomonoides_exilis_PA203 / gene_product=Chain H, Solution Structure Of The Huc Rbd1-Rbd2 Complexed With The Au-Rich Element / transcript_product=Chain H, Solution Structure Of The Huc Rbd1-Rbd2 Complexed With The Au-Rich Element / location=Mono_scaffold00308:1721-4564(-) / protein_length=812 / sequence_SO=supercontig / SO=protein_coding / is_pseudo=false
MSSVLPSLTNSTGHLPSGAYRVESTDQIRIDNPCRLIINYIPPSMTQEAFQKMLAPFGTIVYCKLITDKRTGQCLGYGFVEYSLPTEAGAVIQQLDGQTLLNKRLKVSYSRNPNPDMKNANVYIAGYGSELRQEQLEAIFSNYGTVININMLKDSQGTSRGAAFVRMNSHSEAVNAVSNLNGAKIMGRIIYAKIHSPTTKGGSDVDSEGKNDGRFGESKSGRGDNRGRGRGKGIGKGRDQRGGASGANSAVIIGTISGGTGSDRSDFVPGASGAYQMPQPHPGSGYPAPYAPSSAVQPMVGSASLPGQMGPAPVPSRYAIYPTQQAHPGAPGAMQPPAYPYGYPAQGAPGTVPPLAAGYPPPPPPYPSYQQGPPGAVGAPPYYPPPPPSYSQMPPTYHAAQAQPAYHAVPPRASGAAPADIQPTAQVPAAPGYNYQPPYYPSSQPAAQPRGAYGSGSNASGSSTTAARGASGESVQSGQNQTGRDKEGELASVFVYNIPPSADDTILHKAFSHFGRVQSMTLLENEKDIEGGIKAKVKFGILNFVTRAEAQNAIMWMNGADMAGQRLQVSFKLEPAVFSGSRQIHNATYAVPPHLSQQQITAMNMQPTIASGAALSVGITPGSGVSITQHATEESAPAGGTIGLFLDEKAENAKEAVGTDASSALSSSANSASTPSASNAANVASPVISSSSSGSTSSESSILPTSSELTSSESSSSPATASSSSSDSTVASPSSAAGPASSPTSTSSSASSSPTATSASSSPVKGTPPSSTASNDYLLPTPSPSNALMNSAGFYQQSRSGSSGGSRGSDRK